MSRLIKLKKLFCGGFLLLGLVLPSLVWAEEKNTTKVTPNFEQHIQPILRQHCLKCHGNDKQESDINLQVYAALLRGGSGGKIVVAGRANQSVLFQAITNEDEDARMPPNSPRLSDEKIALIERWIDSGLKETDDSVSLVQTRDLSFMPDGKAAMRPEGPPAMPEKLPEISTPKVNRPLPILAMATSPWAPLLAVSAAEHVRLVHTETEEELGQLPFPEGTPQVIRFSQNGAVLMVAGGRPVESGCVVLYDVRSGKRLAKIGDELDAVMAADISPDQRLIALGGSGRVVKVYSTLDGKLQYQLTKHTDWITAVAFSPDGTKLASGDRAGGIHLWETKEGGILLNLEDHKAAVRALDWRADSKLVVSAGEDGKIIWWGVTDGFPAISKANAHPPTRPSGTYGTIPNGVLAARFAAGGMLATAGRDQIVQIWNSNGESIKKFNIEDGLAISTAISFDGSVAIGGDALGGLHFWRLVQNRPSVGKASDQPLWDFQMKEQQGLQVVNQGSDTTAKYLELAQVDWAKEERRALRFAEPESAVAGIAKGGELEKYLQSKYLQSSNVTPADVVAAIAGTHGGGKEINGLTVAAWIKPAAFMGTTKRGVSTKGDIVGVGARRFILSLVGQNAPFKLEGRLNVNDRITTKTAIISADQWTHVAMTCAEDYGKWDVRLYINGKQVAEG